jgi:DNA-binding GntR family transcriptional regulator
MMYEMAREKILPAQLERRVFEALKNEILSGALAPGAQLVEARIAEELGVSKTPVREALIRLQRDGLVQIEPYRGARVIQPSDRDVAEISELRLVIETAIVRDLAARRPREVLEALERSVSDSRGALEAGDRERFLAHLQEFSDILADACENRRMAKVLTDLRSVLQVIGGSSLRAPGREERSIGEHLAILAAIKAGDSDAAAGAEAAHIRSIEHDSLQFESEPLSETA